MTVEARSKLGYGGAESVFAPRSCAEWATVADPSAEAARADESAPQGPRAPSLTDLSTYADARSFFETVRGVSVELERTREALLRMEAREGVRAQGYEAQGRSGSVSDRTAATDARLDYEERARRRVEEGYELIDLACRVLYGEESGKGGLDLLMGSAVADAINFRYVDARPWSEVAAMVGYSADSAKSLRALCDQGFDCIDFLGWDNVIGGRGEAEG